MADFDTETGFPPRLRDYLTNLDSTELGYLNVTKGSYATGKAVVLGADGKYQKIDITTLMLGGTTVTNAKLTATVIATSAAAAATISTGATTLATTYTAGATVDGSVTVGVDAALAGVNALNTTVNTIITVLKGCGLTS